MCSASYVIWKEKLKSCMNVLLRADFAGLLMVDDIGLGLLSIVVCFDLRSTNAM